MYTGFTARFRSGGGLHEKHVVATWHLGYHLSICSWTQENQEKPASRWPVAGPSGPCPLVSYLYTPAALPHREGLLYPLNRSLNGTQGRPAHVGYLLPLAGRFNSKHYTTAQGSVTCHTVTRKVLGKLNVIRLCRVADLQCVV
jgi:hypothetical protein